MKKDLVSVLMVNYNHADTIEKSIRSVLEQTYSKLQLIIVDDGSTDNSVEIINSIDDPRIELYEEKENKQICAVTNIGMKKVRGEYFARIDSDDLWEKNKLEIQVEYLKNHSEQKICFTHAAIINEKDQIIDSELEKLYAVNYESQEEWLETFFFIGNCLPMTSVLMTTKLRRYLARYPRFGGRHCRFHAELLGYHRSPLIGCKVCCWVVKIYDHCDTIHSDCCCGKSLLCLRIF